jgi:hypothetical protein
MFTFNTFIDGTRSPMDSAGVHVINSSDLSDGGWCPSLSRPYVDDRGRVWVDVPIPGKFDTVKNAAGQPVLNAAGMPTYRQSFEPQLVTERVQRGLPVLNVTNATALRKDQWIMLDNVVLGAARARLRAWADLRAANTFGGFDGMATPILEHEIMTDAGEALVDMEAMAEGRNFQPSFELIPLPLPITHADFWMSERFLAASRAKGQPQDTLRAEMAGRRVGELIEQTLIGSLDGVQYGPTKDALSKVYGYTNHPDRITKTNLTASASATPAQLVDQVIAMRELAYAQNFYGPFMLYVSTGYDAKLDADYVVGTAAQGLASPSGTIRQRIMAIDGITGVRRLDYLSGDVMLLVQMTQDVVQAVNGLEITTVQWEGKGGLMKNFKVMAIQVPRIRSVYISGTATKKTGIVHGTTS